MSDNKSSSSPVYGTTTDTNMSEKIVGIELKSYDNPGFVDETTQENENVIVVSASTSNEPATVHFEINDEDYREEDEREREKELPRQSIVSLSNSVPTLINFEHFLSSAGNNYDNGSVTPPVTLGRPSIVAANHPPIRIEDNPEYSSKLAWKMSLWMQSFPVNLATILFIILSTCVVLADVTINLSFVGAASNDTNDNSTTLPDRDAFAIADLFFSSIMMLETICYVIASDGILHFMSNWLNVINGLVTVSTFCVSVFDLIIEDSMVLRKIKIFQVIRCVRLFRLFRLFTMRKRLTKSARILVSRNKRRYQGNGYDLDLTYVTDRIIAMSAPATGFWMSLYRNPITQVAKFLDAKHFNCYKVYNLCSEHRYNTSYFHGRVERYAIDDHNVPTLKQMMDFTASVRSWLTADPNNIIVVHCKGGKGRTGTMTCVWLVEAGLFTTAQDSLGYFGARRTDMRLGGAFQGVETPSQSRYVGYYELLKNNAALGTPEKELLLQKIRVEEVSRVGNGDGSDFRLEIYTKHRRLPLFTADFKKRYHCHALYLPNERAVECSFFHLPLLQGDVQIIVRSSSDFRNAQITCLLSLHIFHGQLCCGCTADFAFSLQQTLVPGFIILIAKNQRKAPKGCLNAVFYFWFHTNFVENNRLRLTREQLDNPHKPSTWRYFGPKFAVQLDFISLDGVSDPSALRFVPCA